MAARGGTAAVAARGIVGAGRHRSGDSGREVSAATTLAAWEARGKTGLGRCGGDRRKPRRRRAGRGNKACANQARSGLASAGRNGAARARQGRGDAVAGRDGDAGVERRRG